MQELPWRYKPEMQVRQFVTAEPVQVKQGLVQTESTTIKLLTDQVLATDNPEPIDEKLIDKKSVLWEKDWV